MQATGAVGSRVAGGCSRVGKVGSWCGGLVRRADVAGRFGGQVWRVDVALPAVAGAHGRSMHL
jgi:hypothetical protein